MIRRDSWRRQMNWKGALSSLFLFLLMSCHTEQQFPVDGLWYRGGISGDHFGSYYLQLQKRGDLIEGVGCYVEAGQLVYQNLPVSGPYPGVIFPINAKCTYTGQVVARDQIVGQARCTDSSLWDEWDFQREAVPVPAMCGFLP
jgi:hypothetical protein